MTGRTQSKHPSKACAVCGKAFKPHVAAQRCCSKECKKVDPHTVERNRRSDQARRQRLTPEERARRNAARRSVFDPATNEIKPVNLRRYGITVADYERMLAAQDGRCAICRKPPVGTSKQTYRLHVDHDHTTGQVRALLCCGCNRALGYMNDDPELLRAAAEYLVGAPT